MTKLVLTPRQLNQNQERTLNRLLNKHPDWVHHPFDSLELLLQDLREKELTVFPLFLNREIIDLLIEVQKLEAWPQMRSRWHTYPTRSLAYLLDTESFHQQLKQLGLDLINSQSVYSRDELLRQIGEGSFPLILRDSFQFFGPVPRVLSSSEEALEAFTDFQAQGLPLPYYLESPLTGFKEVELVLVRDAYDSSFVIGTAEHLDTSGHHREDATILFPAQTLADKELQFLRDYAIRLARGLRLQGLISLRFAWNTEQGQFYLMQLGLGLNDITLMMSQILRQPLAELMFHILEGQSIQSLASWTVGEPSMDYLVARFPLDFEEESALGSKFTRQSAGQFYAYARNLEAALLKGVAVLEARLPQPVEQLSEDALIDHMVRSRSNRILYLLEGLRRGLSVTYIQSLTHIDFLFLETLANVVLLEEKLKEEPFDLKLLQQAKRYGLSDNRIGKLWKTEEARIWELRTEHGILPTYKEIPGWIGFATAYYSTYEDENEAQASFHPSTVFLYSDQDPWLGQEIWKESILVGSNSPLESGMKQYLEPLTPELIDQILYLENPDKFYGSPRIHSLQVRPFFTRDGFD